MEERIEADYNTVEEGRGRNCNRFSYGHLYAMRRVGLQRLEKKIGMRLIVNTVKCLKNLLVKAKRATIKVKGKFKNLNFKSH